MEATSQPVAEREEDVVLAPKKSQRKKLTKSGICAIIFGILLAVSVGGNIVFLVSNFNNSEDTAVNLEKSAQDTDVTDVEQDDRADTTESATIVSSLAYAPKMIGQGADQSYHISLLGGYQKTRISSEGQETFYDTYTSTNSDGLVQFSFGPEGTSQYTGSVVLDVKSEDLRALYVGGIGQMAGKETIIFVAKDGTVSYAFIPDLISTQRAEIYSVPEMTEVVNVNGVSARADNSTGGWNDIILQRTNGEYYLWSQYLDK